MLKKIFFRILDLFKKYWHKIWGEKMAVKVNRLKKKQNTPQPPILMRSVWSTRDAGPPRRQINLVVKQDGRVGMIDESLVDLESGYDGFVELKEPINLGNKGDHGVTNISFDLSNIINNMIPDGEESELETERFKTWYKNGLWFYDNTRERVPLAAGTDANPGFITFHSNNSSFDDIAYNYTVQKDNLKYPATYETIYSILENTDVSGNVEKTESCFF